MLNALKELALFIGEGPRGDFWNIYSNLSIYIALVLLSLLFYKKTRDEFFSFLALAFSVFIIQKGILFFAIASMHIWHIFTPNQVEPWFPAMEHFFETVAILLLAFSCCYISLMFRGIDVKIGINILTPWKCENREERALNYILIIGITTAFLGYLYVSIAWLEFFNQSFLLEGRSTTFGKFWGDILIEYIHAAIYLCAMVYIAYRNYPLKRGNNKHSITTLLVISFGLGFFGHLLHVVDLAHGEENIAITDSVKRIMEFTANFFFFGVVFLRLSDRMTQKRKKLELTLKEVREFTKAFIKISDDAKKSKYLNFNINLPEIRSDDLLKQLSHSIKNMIESIRKREDNVQSSSQELQVLNEELSSTYEELRHLYNDQEKHIKNLKRTQNDLIAEKNKVDAILASIGDGLSIQDKDFNVIFTNDFYYQLWGKGIIGKKCYKAYEKHDEVCPDCPLKEAYDTGEVVRTTRKGKDKSGNDIHVDITASPIIDENGTIIGGIELAKDVTKRVQLEERLKKNIDDLNEANIKLVKMDKIKTNFVGMASHELRTPLTMIKGYSELLMYERKDTLDDVNYDMISNIHTSAERLNGIITDILDISRIDDEKLHLSKQKSDIQITFDQTAKDLKHYLDMRVHDIKISVSDDVDMFYYDPGRMYQALSNLIANAIKYTPDGGKIELSAALIKSEDLKSRVSNEDALTKALKRHYNEWLEIIVKDNGIGVDIDEQKHIFDRFYEVGSIDQHTTSKSAFMGGGAGLGLSICKGIVEAHNGVIWIYSKGYDLNENNGSEFHIILPYLTDEEEIAHDKKQSKLPFINMDD